MCVCVCVWAPAYSRIDALDVVSSNLMDSVGLKNHLCANVIAPTVLKTASVMC